MIERYKFDQELGRSPHAVTTLRTDTERGTRCVLKSLNLGEVDDLKIVELFHRESKVLRGLDHPGIPRFLDAFEERGEKRLVLHLVQEYIEGENLAEARSRRGNLDEREVIRIARELLAILRYLHSCSPPIIHRDIKPGNVILAKDGTVHLIDFSGVRDMLEQDRNAEGGFTIIGSYGYMPFEQYEGRAFPASDIYALGMTLIFLVTGREPSDLDRDGMRLVVPDDASVTPAFREALGRMIEPDVEKRFQSVGDVERALPAEPAAREPRSPAAATAGFAALLALLVVALVLVFNAPTGEPADAGVSNASAPVLEPTRPRASAATATVEPGGPMQYEGGWKSFEPVPPDPASSKLVAQGLITYAAQPFGMKVSATPRLTVWSDAASGNVVTPMRYENGEVEIFDLGPGVYRVWATWWDGANRYHGGHEVRVEDSRVVQFEFHMTRSIEIAAIAGAERREGSCELVSASPVVIAWKPFEDGTIFDYDVYEGRCDNKGRGVPLSSGSTKQLSLTLSLPPNKPGMRYQVNLGARRNGTWVGNGGMTFAVGEAGGL